MFNLFEVYILQVVRRCKYAANLCESSFMLFKISLQVGSTCNAGMPN